jgi:hypothetical protein
VKKSTTQRSITGSLNVSTIEKKLQLISKIKPLEEERIGADERERDRVKGGEREREIAVRMRGVG